ncbi:hypothetical protein NQ314_020349 [Rhamnusium bicolor]|uniref:Uncharacterized protein n=1 Tax=Rhamnusium bicolor TaxID=1586634 RepID=A0AAV8WKV3_9CUCU|nr:hypothetical protein NQ314_020349 [Rhamnusium bicolor]
MSQRDEKYKPLIEFRSDIAHGLLKAGKENKRKRGRPSSATPSAVPTPPPLRKKQKLLLLSVMSNLMDLGTGLFTLNLNNDAGFALMLTCE